jgi:hypothetical protein
LPGVKFIVIGGGTDLETMKKQSEGLNIEFTGQIKHVKEYLQIFDVFLYPLSETHQGTCEQVLGEAMAVGLPCIVLNNPAERYIIKNKINGFLCNNQKQILQTISDLYFKTVELNINLVKKFAKTQYSVDRKIRKWNKIFDKIMKSDKKTRKWKSKDHIFIESLGPFGKQFKKNPKKLISENYYQWHSKKKGSLNHYYEFFPDDKKLKEWLKFL